MLTNPPSEELRQIRKQLPNYRRLLIEDEQLLDSGEYKLVFVSVFDHWLSPSEAQQLIDVDNNKTELLTRRMKFESLIRQLSENTQLYVWKFKRHRRIFIQKPQSIEDILRRCQFESLSSMRGKQYSILLPEYSAVMHEEWDWTNAIWYKNKEMITPLLDLAKSNGLHILV